MSDFNPNDIGIANGNFFGLPVSLEESEIVLVSVPWDATVSYSKGTSNAPEAIMDASLQVDLFDLNVPDAWKVKIGTAPFPEELVKTNKLARIWAERVIDSLSQGKSQADLSGLISRVNDGSRKMNDYVYSTSKDLLAQGRIVGIVGGEHSVPLGLIKALGERYSSFGVLHIDAHADLREAYEGFQYSHASIMYNVLHEVPQVSRLTQVAIRDFCDQEYRLIQTDERITSFPDFQIKKSMFEGESFASLCDRIVNSLPDNVYISFDIDGLSPEYCPGTGTPVPGGLSFSQAEYLLYRVAVSGKCIIGFDLNEVGPQEGSEWDANVGARMLYKLALLTHKNRKK